MSLSLSFPTPGKEGKTRNLQKGLSIIENGQPLCAEGMGFGVPVIVIGPNTYTSLDAEVRTVRLDGTEILKKTYLLNAVEVLEFRGQETRTRIPLVVCEALSGLYKRLRPMQILLPLWSSCVRQVGFRTVWKKTEPVAELPVKYSFSPGEVLIEVDLRAFRLVRNKARIYLLNELGAEHFPKYWDSNGLFLERTKIGGWVKVRASRACFTTEDGALGFCLEKREGVELFRGWESIPGQLSWAGLIYDLTAYESPLISYSITFPKSQDGALLNLPKGSEKSNV